MTAFCSSFRRMSLVFCKRSFDVSWTENWVIKVIKWRLLRMLLQTWPSLFWSCCVPDVGLCMKDKFLMSTFDWQANNQSNCTIAPHSWGRMEFGKMFGIDCRWFLFFPPPSLLPPPPSLTYPLPLLAHVWSLPEKGNEMADYCCLLKAYDIGSTLQITVNNWHA